MALYDLKMGMPLLFKSEEERDKTRDEIRKGKANANKKTP